MKKLYLVFFVILFSFYNSLSYGNELQNIKPSQITVASYDFISKDAWLPKFSPDNTLLFYFDKNIDKGIIIDATTYKKKYDFVFMRTDKGIMRDMFKSIAWHPNGEKIVYLNSAGNPIIVDLKENKQIKLPVAFHMEIGCKNVIKWQSDSEIYFSCGYDLFILNLDNLKKTPRRKLSKEDLMNIFGIGEDEYRKKQFFYKMKNLCINMISGSGITITNSSNTYRRILIEEPSTDKLHRYDVTSDLEKIAVIFQNRNKYGLYVAKLGLREEPKMVFNITLDKKTQLTPYQRKEFEKYFRGATVKGKVYAPSINPLNNKVIGPDRNHFKGYVRFTKSGDVNSTVETLFEHDLIKKGDIVTNIDSNFIGTHYLSNIPSKLWAVLE